MNEQLREAIYRVLIDHNTLAEDAKCSCGTKIESLHPVFVTEYDWAAHVSAVLTEALTARPDLKGLLSTP